MISQQQTPSYQLSDSVITPTTKSDSKTGTIEGLQTLIVDLQQQQRDIDIRIDVLRPINVK